MKIYTQTGDQGETSLLSGERVAKNHIRVKTYGEVDELNAVIGAVVAALPEPMETVAASLQGIQNELFQLGGWLAATPGSKVSEPA